MNILYVEFHTYNKVSYGNCIMRAVYSDLYNDIRSWEADDHRKMYLLAIF